MDDILEALVVILGIIFAAVASSKKKKQGKTASKSKARVNRAQAAKPASPPESDSTEDNADSEWEEAIASALPEAAKPIAHVVAPITASAGKATMRVIQSIESRKAGEKAPASELPSGESVTDAEGCIGGSIGPHREEGEIRAEHARHIAESDNQMAADEQDRPRAHSLRSIRTGDLRRAVVMSEILDKPMALRNSRAPYSR